MMLYAAYNDDPFARQLLEMLSGYDQTVTLLRKDAPPPGSAIILTFPSRLRTTYLPIRVIDPRKDERLLANVPTYAMPAQVHIAAWHTDLNSRIKKSIARIPTFLGHIVKLRASAA
jgi:hypothetical protein